MNSTRQLKILGIFLIFSVGVFILANLIYAQPEIDKGSLMEEEKNIAKEAMSELSRETTATALIKGTQSDSKLYGEIELTEEDEGVSIFGEFFNVPNSGKHGIHVHENGSCEDAGNAAGGHFNPDHAQHGFLPADGIPNVHAGDMGNIEIGDNGEGALSVFLKGASLTEGNQYNLVGKSIILHEKEDDFGQPTGNAGGRIGCGVIELKRD